MTRLGHTLDLLVRAGLLAAAMLGAGCVAVHLAGAMAQNEEYQKLLEILPKYDDLPGHRVAVLVDADLATLYEHPNLIAQVTGGLALRIAKHVQDVHLVNPDAVLAWQYQTPLWNAMSYGEIAAALDVDRVVYIDIYEYRLNPPGNRYFWEGLCAANIHIIERDYFDPDMFSDSFEVAAEFPPVKHLDRGSASEQAIETGLLFEFVQRTAWLFYTHTEPKHPDKYRPEMDTTRNKDSE